MKSLSSSACNEVLKEAYRFSHKTISYIKNSIETCGSENIFICGSISRNEALPMCDIDLVSIGKSSFNLNMNSYPATGFDRLDRLQIDNETSAQRLLDCMSPEAGFLDSRPLIGKPHSFFEKFNSHDYLTNKFIVEYHDSRLFNDRSSFTDYNLKYTPGGYRDILLINIGARAIGQENHYYESEIVQSIKYICDLIPLDSITEQDIINCIAFVMATKSNILMSHQNTDTRGRTQLNNETLQETLRFISQHNMISCLPIDMESFWGAYKSVKQLICVFVDCLYRYISQNNKHLIWEQTKAYLSLINTSPPYTSAQIGIDEEFFPIISVAIHFKYFDKSQLLQLAVRFSKDPGHYYTNRLLAKSDSVDKSLLTFMLDNSTFAIDKWTNDRYKGQIRQRIYN